MSDVLSKISGWSVCVAPGCTRAALAIIFIWFGGLKLAGVSPAAALVSQTFFFLPAAFVVPALGALEVAIGALLCFRRTLGIALVLLALHLPGTFLSFLIVPERCFHRFPFLLTTEGEFILKNLVIISAGIFLTGYWNEQSRQQWLAAKVAS